MTHAMEILLVEDSPQDVELTLHALKQSHLANHVTVLRDGAEALEYFFPTNTSSPRTDDSLLPRLILLDLKLPKIDGFEVLRRLKSTPATRRIPVVVLTSSREQRDIVDSYELGVNSYIVKPVDFDQFVHAIQELGLYWLLLNEPPVRPDPTPH